MSYQSVARYLVSKHIETDKESSTSEGKTIAVSKQIPKQTGTEARQLTSKEAALLAASREAAKQSLAREVYIAEQRFSKFLEEADKADSVEARSIAESKAIQWFKAYQDATNKLLKASGQIRSAEISAAREAESEDTQTINIVWVGWADDGN